MDKSSLPYNDQMRFFTECMKIYTSSAQGAEKRFFLPLFTNEVIISCPSESRIEVLLKTLCTTHQHQSIHTGFNIFITESGRAGFETPESPYDRFRFTRRGEIQGCEEGRIKTLYFHRYSSICVVNSDERAAVILMREPSVSTPEEVLHTIVAVLSLLPDEEGILFFPAEGIIENNKFVLLVDPGNELQNISEQPPAKNTPEPVQHWMAVKMEPDPVAVALSPTVKLHEAGSHIPCSISSIRSKAETTARLNFSEELRNLRLFSATLFSTLSLLPCSGKQQMDLIEKLFLKVQGFNPAGCKPEAYIDSLPSLSVIIPAYNAAPFLREAVASIASLRYPKAEVIIVDDGSTDATSQLIPELPIDCRYIFQPNSGASAARNRGLSASSGEIVVFLDADDLLNPPAFYSLLANLLNNPEAVAVTGHAQKFRTGRNGERIMLGSPAESFPFYIGAALFRRAAFDLNGAFDTELRFSEDTDWFIRAREKNLSVLRSSEISLFVRRHQGNLTKDLSLNDLQILTMLRKKIARGS